MPGLREQALVLEGSGAVATGGGAAVDVPSSGAARGRGVGSTVVLVGVLSGVSSLGLVLRDLVIAQRFGLSAVLDSFLIAYLVPTFMVNVLGGSLPAALIPTYVAVRREQGEVAGARLLGSVTHATLLLLLGVTVVTALAVPLLVPVLGSGFDRSQLRLAAQLMLLMLPAVVLAGMVAVWGAVLNVRDRYAIAAAAPVTVPLAAVLALVLAGGERGVYALAVGTVLGFAVQLVILGGAVRRLRVPIRPVWSGLDAGVRRIGSEYAAMIGFALLMNVSLLIDQGMAATLGPGAVSALTFGNKLLALGLSVGALALTTAVLPHFAQLVAAHDWVGVRATLRHFTLAIIAVSVPIVVVLVLLSPALAELLFERGAFTAADTAVVARVQSLYLLQLPFTLLGVLGARLLNALRRNRVLTVIAVVNIVTNVVGNVVLMRWLGVAGISLSTVIVHALSMVLIFVAVARALPRRGEA